MLSLAAFALGACSLDVATYTIGRYGCYDTYEVFDRPDAASLVVVTNGVNEALAACGDTATLPKQARMRRIAELYFTETTNRPFCQVRGEVELSPLVTEVAYRCSADPARAEVGKRRSR